MVLIELGRLGIALEDIPIAPEDVHKTDPEIFNVNRPYYSDL